MNKEVRVDKIRSGFNHETLGRGQISGTNTWLTPPEIVKSLGHFDLDPCAAPHPRPWDLATNNFDYSQGQDGLLLPWKGRCFVNPPYKVDVAAKFIEKLSTHKDGGVALLFARTETKTWQKIIWPRSSAILFLDGRLSFYTSEGVKGGTAGTASILVAFTEQDAVTLRNSGLKGCLVIGKEMV